MEIILKDFTLKTFNSSLEHQNIINQLNTDPASNKYLGNLNYMLERILIRHEENHLDNLYIVYHNDEPIGIITLSLIKAKYKISYGILPKYRHQGLAPLLTKEFSQKIFEIYQRINKLTLDIDSTNIYSQKSALASGYTYDSENNNYIIKK